MKIQRLSFCDWLCYFITYFYISFSSVKILIHYTEVFLRVHDYIASKIRA